MHHRNRIGEILSQMVSLSHHDIDEILVEQRSTHRRFGEIAISMGLCQSEHVWKAISGQPTGAPMFVDLDAFGVDSQAIAHLPSQLARELGIIPVRTFGDGFVVAAHQDNFQHASDRLAVDAVGRVIILLADRDKIATALERYYPMGN